MSLPETIKHLAMSKRGLIILVGATGTGKSTSLAALYRLCTAGEITYDAAIASADSANDLRLMIKLVGSAPPAASGSIEGLSLEDSDGGIDFGR